MSKITKRLGQLNNPRLLVHKTYGWFLEKISPLLSDRLFLKLRWRYLMGYNLDLKNPKTFNEKIQWLKLYNRKKIYSRMVDKAEAKIYVANIIGKEYIIPTIKIYNTVEDIDFDDLPNKFVLKCTHDSGGVVICNDKSSFDRQAALIKLRTALKTNFYNLNREWPYKNVKPRIIAEEYMEDTTCHELVDYKFFCFDGVVKAMFVASDRQKKGEETKFDFFDENYNHLNILNGHPMANVPPKKPSNFEKMKELAEKLSQNIPHLRVDFYEVDGKIYFGELTFFHWSGFVPFEPQEWDTIFGEWLALPNN